MAGDVVELVAGDVVPADCRLLAAPELEVDESSLTGESVLAVKSTEPTAAPGLGDRHSMLYEGTVVVTGRAVAVVVATGNRTESGRTAQASEGTAPPTGVQTRLRVLAKSTVRFSIGAGLGLLAVDLTRGQGVAHALGRAVNLAVASVPEGLPFVATVAELAAARRLATRGVLTRNPSTIEALGRVDMVCFDKTGTLTEGRISVAVVSDGAESRPVDALTPPLRQVLAAAALASPWQSPEHEVAHQTDRAVLQEARRLGVSPEQGDGTVAALAERPFESGRGYHATLSRSGGEHLLSVKGAPEVVLPRCTLSRQTRRAVDAEVERLAQQGHRVLVVAERPVPDALDIPDARVHDLEYRGLLALADRVRPTAARAVTTLNAAGVQVMMITGDHPGTARAIADELGLLGDRRVVVGAELDGLNDEELAALASQTGMFARVSPAQKAHIVRALQQAGRVVAVTGDGTNDAPAIRIADVGIALGSRATPAARQAADVVITENLIETIIDAVIEGRAMWTSVRDALSILLGGNLGEIGYALLTGLLSGEETLNARQLLLVNLLTDVLPAMAVAVRPPPDVSPDQLLASGPEAALGAALTRDIYLRAVATAAAAAAAWLLARPTGTPGQASTTGLVALVGAQHGQTLAVRGRTPLVAVAALGSLLLLAVAVQVPGISRIVGCRPLLPHQWGIALTAAILATAAQLLAQRLTG
nr:HAD-IC family P-type ATPase [Pseudonocardia nigra]